MASRQACPEWSADLHEGDRARRQREAVLDRLAREDYKLPPSIEMVRRWHRDMFAGVAPHDDYAGNFRHLDRAGPRCLYGVWVYVGTAAGSPPGEVAGAVGAFIAAFGEKVAALDAAWAAEGDRPTPQTILATISLAAWAHGEWVRIHPFINGNGRTARLWGNYVFRRYGFDLIPIRPRPGGDYGEAARLSMLGFHRKMEEVYARLLNKQIQDRLKGAPG